MPTKKQVKAAARKVRKTRNATVKKQNRQSAWIRIWNAICWPFHKIAKLFRKLWNWICGINFIGLLNSTLLISIIVLFSMLIIEVYSDIFPIIAPKKVPMPVVTPDTTTYKIILLLLLILSHLKTYSKKSTSMFIIHHILHKINNFFKMLS